MDTLLSAVLAAGTALVPAAMVWWSGRKWIPQLDDPALPERLQAEGQRRGAAAAIAFVVIGILWTRHLVWAIPLTFLGAMAASYPLRKALYDETWTLAGYLGFHLKLILALMGFWVLVAAAPGLVLAAGGSGWIAAALIAVTLVLWEAGYVDVIRRMLAVTPIRDAQLGAAFERMALECRLGAPDSPGGPRLEQVHVPGGVIANAIALPSLRRSSVVFSDTLLQRLTAPEIEAICAHEVAHLEHYNRLRLRRARLAAWAIITSAVVAAPIAGSYAPFLMLVLPYGWVGIVIMALVLRSRARQAHETASDLRAIALTGNPEALISALTKLHAIARVPRRWDTQFEQQATHPSLARRIQAIRAAAGRAPATLGTTATFTTAGGDGAVTFHDTQLTWTERHGASHTAAYDQLVELRVHAAASGPRVVIVDRTRRRWEVPLAAADVARAQAVLDIVDARLAAAAPRPLQPVLVRWLAATVGLSALALAHWAAALVAALALFRPASNLIAAAGAAALMAGTIAWRDGLPTDTDPRPWIGLVLIGVAPLLFVVAYRTADRMELKRPATALGAGLALLCGLTMLGGGHFDAVSIYNAARSSPGLSVLPVALAALIVWPGPDGLRRRNSARAAAAVGLLAVGLGNTVAGSTVFLDRFNRDAFLQPGKAITVTVVDDAPIAEFAVPFAATSLRLSSDARFAAFAELSNPEERRIHVGRVGGQLHEFEGDEVYFLNDRRALIVRHRQAATVVREIALGDEPAPIREHRFAGMRSARVVVKADSGRWQLVGVNDEDAIVAVEHDAGGTATERQWRAPGASEYFEPLYAGAAGPIVYETRYDTPSGLASSLWWLRFTPLMPYSLDGESSIFTARNGERVEMASTRLMMRCSGAVIADRPVCAAFDGTRTRLVTVGVDGAPVQPLLTIPGYFIEEGSDGEWMTGWWQASAIALRLDTGEAIRLERSGTETPSQLAAADRALGALIYHDGQTRVRIYALP